MIFWSLVGAGALVWVVGSIRLSRVSQPLAATLAPPPASTIPSTQTLAPATQAQLQSFFQLFRTHDTGPTVFSGPATQPSRPPQ